MNSSAPDPVDIELVFWRARQALLTDGRLVPITHFFGPNGEEVDGPDEAISFVCGEGRTWFGDQLSHYHNAVPN